MINRRTFINTLAASSLAVSSAPLWARTGLNSSKRFVFIILRGAMDGMGALPAIGDPDFTNLNGRDQDYDGFFKLDSTFALHPSLKHMHSLYKAGEASFIPAMAGPYQTRSHFDAQDFLEFGSAGKSSLRSGWMARIADETKGDKETAVALSKGLPINLQGTDKALAWAPARSDNAADDTLERLAMLYGERDVMAKSLETAINSENIASDMASPMMEGGRAQGKKKEFVTLAAAAGKFLSTDGGPTLAMLELGGWDTHNGEINRLKQQFDMLDAGVEALQVALGDDWANTCVVISSEFGRTANFNGTGGTDHGTGGAGFLLGGAVKGGRVLGDWAGLKTANLYEGRDLMPTNSTYALIGGIIHEHLGFDRRQIKSDILPGMKGDLMSGLV